MIYRYRKQSDEHTTYSLLTPEGCQELATLDDGYTYVYVQDGEILPLQPEQITAEKVVLTEDLRRQIKDASPQCRLIYARMQERIRAKYCSEDEMYLTRIAVGQLAGLYEMEEHEPALIAEYQAFIEEVRVWGREERAKLGL